MRFSLSAEHEIAEAGCTVETIADDAELCRRTALAIADGKVVGWFQGRMEWGPRALGNRSILCDPRRADMKEILNRKIKRRESFRPFAPSVLDEACRRMVRGGRRRPLHDAGVPDPRRKAAAHPRSHPCRRLRPLADRVRAHQSALLRADRQLPQPHRRADGAEHVVQRKRAGRVRAEEALDCFLRTRMDVLVMGHAVLCRANVS